MKATTKFQWLMISVIILILLYFLTRLINLLGIPIFTDEAIYLRWAQIALGDPRWRLISLVDGKQPLFIWLLLPAIKFITDPLLAGRLTSVMVGFSGFLGMIGLGYVVSKRFKVGLIAGVLYLLSPFFLLYDRLALYESLVLSISIWALLLTYLLGKTLRYDVALILGGVVGFGFLTKSSLGFLWFLLPLTVFLMDFKKSQIKPVVLKWTSLLLIVTLVSQLMIKVLYLAEFRHMVRLKNLTFVYSINEFLEKPYLNLWGNLVGLSGWLISYLTLPVFFLVLVSLIWYLRKNFRQGLFFLGYFLIPFVALAWFGKVIYPRFLLFMLPPLFLLMALFVNEMIKKKPLILIIFSAFLIFAYPIYFQFRILTDPVRAPIPRADYNQFINDWPAGYGISEIVTFLNNQTKTKEVVIGTEGTFGLFPMALELYLGSNQNVKILPYWPVNEVPEELQELAKTKETYLVFKEKQEIPSEWPLILVNQYQRGIGPTYMKFYRVLPKS